MAAVYETLVQNMERRGAVFFLLIDPDSVKNGVSPAIVECCREGHVDAVLVGGSLMMRDGTGQVVSHLRKETQVPVILFPGNARQLCPEAAAVLYLSLISGRNPHYLIGEHVLASPIIHEMGMETIPTGYMLIESGGRTTAEYISNTIPIPREKSDIAVAHALAAQHLGMKLVYLEGGSGAKLSVPNAMIAEVAAAVSLPVLVGGGIRTPENAAEKVAHGAKGIVIGQAIEESRSAGVIREFADAIHKDD